MTGVTAVIDTNVLLDFWVFEDRDAAPLRAAIESGAVTAWRSEPDLAEFEDVLARPSFGLDAARRDEILRLWHRLAQPAADVKPAPWICTDRRDQMFLDLAYSVRADWLVTKDKALLQLAPRARVAGLTIAEPRHALERVPARDA
jgi:putative PIN family toxin of toxin-antitoxin system